MCSVCGEHFGLLAPVLPSSRGLLVLLWCWQVFRCAHELLRVRLPRAERLGSYVPHLLGLGLGAALTPVVCVCACVRLLPATSGVGSPNYGYIAYRINNS